MTTIVSLAAALLVLLVLVAWIWAWLEIPEFTLPHEVMITSLRLGQREQIPKDIGPIPAVHLEGLSPADFLERPSIFAHEHVSMTFRNDGCMHVDITGHLVVRTAVGTYDLVLFSIQEELPPGGKGYIETRPIERGGEVTQHSLQIMPRPLPPIREWWERQRWHARFAGWRLLGRFDAIRFRLMRDVGPFDGEKRGRS